MSNEAVLAIEDLSITIDGRRIVDGLSLEVRPGECLALVGESGCGKTLSALAAIGLLPGVARVSSGSVRVQGRELVGLDAGAMNTVRGSAVSMIFQEPVLSLNPLLRVGDQIAEGLRVHGGLGRGEARERTLEMLGSVGIPSPERRARQYPHELSGGMCQRVMIAAALIMRPALLIADEPTTALDVTIQAQILELVRRLRDETATSVLLITHDMGVVAETADRVAVMYAGRVAETAEVDALLERQYHPYTNLLLRTVPSLDTPRKSRLPAIAGTVPDPADWPAGCRFSSRCPLVDERCRHDVPPLVPPPSELRTGEGSSIMPSADAGIAPGRAPRLSACWHAERAVEAATHA